MRTFCLSTIFFSFFLLNINSLFAQNTFVPDDNFEQALIDLGYDSGMLNDSVPITSIKYVENLNISNRNITNLTGIEHFTSLKKLYCGYNKISSLNLSNITNLTFLDCSENLLIQLDLHINIFLQSVYCSYNKLIELDFSSNSNLTHIDCRNNELTGLNVRNGNNSNLFIETRYNSNLFCIQVDDASAAYTYHNWYKNAYTAYSENCTGYVIEMSYIPNDNFERALTDLGLDSGGLNDSVPTIAVKNLKGLNVSNKNITDLAGIEDFIALEQLDCSDNQISAINLTTAVNLKVLQIQNNKLSDLDLSLNSFLNSFDASSNQLTGLNLRNGNNANMGVNAQYNPDLLCIQVDDEVATYTYSNWYKNAYTGFSEDCSSYVMKMTYVPDDNFEQTLINMGLDFGTLNDSVPAIGIKSLISLDVSNRSIYDLTGIEEFEKIMDLNCNSNYIEFLNLSKNAELLELNCNYNQLAILDFQSNIKLTKVNCQSNPIVSINLRNNTNLEYLNCSYCQLTNLNLQNNDKLIHFAALKTPPLCIQVNNIDEAEGKPNWYIDVFSNYSLDCSDHIVEKVYLPDDNFENALINMGYDYGIPNDSVYKAIVNSITNLSIYNQSIKSLQGIEEFSSLENLDINDNDISELNLDSNLNLKNLSLQYNHIDSLNLFFNRKLNGLDCTGNQLNTLDLKSCLELQILWCSSNNLQNLDISNNIKLTEVNCGDNNLAELNLSSNTLLERLWCSDNQISSLDISHQDSLIHLSCINNKLSELDFSENILLKWIFCGYNQLTSLDLSINPNLFMLNCENNNISSLNLKNGNNEYIYYVYAQKNPALFCIQVDDAVRSKYSTFWHIDQQVVFSENCSQPFVDMTYVPDDNFEQALIDLGYDTWPLDDSVLTAKIITIASLNIESRNVSDLTGIEDFIALNHFICARNKLKTLNLSFNTALTTLNCEDNQINDLNLNANIRLENLHCSRNQLTELEVGNNKKFEFLQCNNNQLSSIDLSDNTALIDLYCFDNNLTFLNIKNGNNKNLRYFSATGNKDLFCIQVDDPEASLTYSNLTYSNWRKADWTSYSEDCSSTAEKTYIPDDNFEQALIDLGYDSGELDDSVSTTSIQEITSLDVSDKNISSMQGIEDFINLSSIYCHNSKITQLNLNNNKQLAIVGCSYNQISEISVDSLVNLVRFECAINLLTNINISNNPHLSYFDCSNNQLTYIDATSNLELTNLICPNNRLTELGLHLNSKLVELHCGDNQILSLDLSNNIKLHTLYCYRNNLSELNIKNGNNSQMTGNGHEMKAHNNPNLTCIQVDDASLAVGYSDWLKDSWTKYSDDCNFDGPGVPRSEYNSLVDLYYSTQGDGWTINTNWLDTARSVDTWYGVNIEDGHVTQILLNNNNLQNTAFEEMIRLPKLKLLDLGNNKLTGFHFQGTDSLVSLDAFLIDNNQLIFEDLIPAFSTLNYSNFSKQFNYSPQAKIGTTENIIKMTDENFSVEIAEQFLSPNDQFQWYKEYLPLEGGTNSGIDFFPVLTSDSGSYHLQITNYVPNLTLYSELIHIEVTNSLVDSLLLFDLTQKYPQLKTIWDNNDPFSTWPGVTFENGKVTTLNLSGLQLEGDFSSFFTDFDSLKWLDLSNNKLSGEFPKIGAINNSTIKSNGSNIQNLKYLDISNNNFVFAELEPAFNFFQTIDTFIYAPQSMVGLPFDTTIYKNKPLTFKIANYTPGSFDSYSWSKDGTEITDANEFTFAIKNAAPGDSGYYTCAITNLLFPELTLLSDTSSLNVLIPVGIDDFNNTHFNIYPNPAEKQIFVETGKKTVNLKIFDIVGKLFFEKENFISGWINIEPFTSGIYFVRITSQNSETITKKVIFK